MAEQDRGAGRKEKEESGGRAGARLEADAAQSAASGSAAGTERKGSGGMSVGKAVLMITQIGISMLAPIFVGGLIGRWLARLTDAGFLFLVFLAFGFLAAFRNVYRLTRPFYAEDLRREQQELAYWKQLEQERAKNRAAAGRGAGGQDRVSEAGSGQSGGSRYAISESGPPPGSSAAGLPRESEGVRARRLRARLAEQRREAGPAQEAPKDRRQEAEEEFNAWRKRNGAE